LQAKFIEILDKVSTVSAKLQIAGIDCSSSNELTNEFILDLVSQMKALKISVACNQRFGTLY
jgi:hypothetical protein